ncbi:HutD family protein [Xenorhabdus budapestensis]|uniref:HutD family protein n=2 Tax=Xenorhabdus budapestensis TaxID=290110 RepID=A0ABX7VCH5_XENBU|nr:HutD family protein [Xenorhabdus budapestensis]QTL38458.1 HutD family protein [Xenorhabdus budapestensis]
MRMKCFDYATLPREQWAGGIGEVRDIVCWPVADDFAWRVCFTSIYQNGALGQFPDIDRSIVLLKGKGIRLTSPGFLEHELVKKMIPFHFSGDIRGHAELLDGSVQCFNILTRRSSWGSEISVVTAERRLPTSHSGVLYVLRGRWEMSGTNSVQLAFGQGAWWLPEDIREGAIKPLVADSQLLWVDLHPNE